MCYGRTATRGQRKGLMVQKIAFVWEVVEMGSRQGRVTEASGEDSSSEKDMTSAKCQCVRRP